MGAYTGLQATADALIRKKGAVCTLVRKGATNFDPVAQTSTPGDQSATTAAVAIPPGKSDEFKIGTLVGRKLMKFYLSMKGQSLLPLPGDQLTWAGTVYKLVWTSLLSPAGDDYVLAEAFGETA